MPNIVPMQSRQSIELRQHQQLALTPALQQSIRFLQLSAQDLELEVAQALLENPLLERAEEYDTEAGDAEHDAADNDVDDRPVLALTNRSSSFEDDADRPEASPAETLPQHLLRQLQLTRASARDRALVSVLIDELDENGYLPTPLTEIASFLPVELHVEVDELQTALHLLQSFDPVGVGAVSLSECLQLQLKQCVTNVEPTVMACALDLAGHYLDLLASGNLSRLRTALSCSQETLKAAHGLLLGLNPKPGRDWANSCA
ncbi:MAG TPA: RNA polymerase sigma-54 factor, partial [Eoetvoesiella sp.]